MYKMWNYEEVFHDVEQPTFFHEASRCIDFTPSINSLLPVRLHYLLVLRLDPSALIQNALICAPFTLPKPLLQYEAQAHSACPLLLTPLFSEAGPTPLLLHK